MRRSVGFTWVSALLVVVLVLGNGGVLSASEPTAEELAGLAGLVGEELSDEELDDVSGHGAGKALGGGIAGGVIGYLVATVLDYYGVGDWIKETALPAIEQGVKDAYETVKRGRAERIRDVD